MAVTVELIRNVLTHKFLTNSGNVIGFHNLMRHQDNFHLYNNGPTRNLQVFSNSDKKFTLSTPTAGGCNQGFSLGSTGSPVYVTSSSAGAKLYVKDSNGDKYYLRINIAQNSAVELVCQSYVDSVSENPWLQQETEFDLVTIDIQDLTIAD